METPRPTVPATFRTLANALTLEIGVYVILALTALVLRVSNLDTRPLAPGEAQTAVAAWDFLNGKPIGVYGSPLLFTLDWLAFFLFGAFDLTARLLPAVLASALVFLPALARRALGRTGALVAAAIIAVSPSLVFFARTLSGADLAVGAGLAALILYRDYQHTPRARQLYTAALLTAVALTADSTGFTVLAAGALFFAVSWFRARRNVPAALENSPSQASHLLGSPGVRAPGVFVLMYLLLATTFLLDRDGLGVAFNLLARWLGGLAAIGSLTAPLNLLLVYEPLALIFGLAGLALVFTARDEAGMDAGLLRLLSITALFSLIWYSVTGGKTASDMVAVGLPLVLVAGWFIGNLFERAAEDVRLNGGWRSVLTGELPVFFMLLVLAALIYLQVVTFLQQTRFSPALDAFYRLMAGSTATVSMAAAALTLVLVTLVLLGVFVGLSILLIGAARTMTLLALVILLLLSLGMLRATVALNFYTDEPVRELAADAQTPIQMRDLVRDLEFFSQWRAGDPRVLRVAADSSLGDALRWYLRRFANVVWTTNVGAVTGADAVLSPAGAPPPGNWRGQRYRIQAGWDSGSLAGIELWRWFVFRQGGGETWQTTMLWLPTETGNQAPPQP